MDKNELIEASITELEQGMLLMVKAWDNSGNTPRPSRIDLHSWIIRAKYLVAQLKDLRESVNTAPTEPCMMSHVDLMEKAK